jgi:flavodoxin
MHFSPTGGTKKVADIICSALEGDFNEIDLCSNIEQTSLNEEDISSSWRQKGQPSISLICRSLWTLL